MTLHVSVRSLVLGHFRKMEDVIKLPPTEEDRPSDKKRTQPVKCDAASERRKRQKNAERLAVLGEEDGSVKLLEELVFGAEEELVDRLVEVTSTSNHPGDEVP